MVNTSREWAALYDRLKREIQSGNLSAEEELAQHPLRFTCSKSDWRAVIDLLIADGLVSGSAERPAVAQTKARSIRSASFLEDYRLRGRSPSIRTLELAVVRDLPDDLSDFLTGESPTHFVRHLHLQSVDAEPHAICDSYVPFEFLGPSFEELRDGQKDLWAFHEAAQVPATDKEEHLYFDWAHEDEKAILDLVQAAAVPLIRLRCAVWSNGTLIEVCHLADRADLYEFRYRIQVK